MSVKKNKTEEEIKIEIISKAMKDKSIYYIVDTENVHKSSYVDLTGLRKKDILKLMYTEHSKCIDYNTLEVIHKCLADIRFKSFGVIQATKDLLDFKMVVEGTSVIAKSNKYFVVFITEDKGFDSAVDYINELYGKRCTRLDKIINIQPEKENNTKKTKGGGNKVKEEFDPLKI